MGVIVGIKGLEAPFSKNNISKMVRALNKVDMPAEEFRYVSFLLGDTWGLHKIFRTVDRMHKALRTGDSIVAHSFGGVLTTELLQKMSDRKSDLQLKNIYMFNPSVDADIIIPETHFEKMYIFCDCRDQMLNLAKLMPFNKLGSLGKYGYEYDSDKIHSLYIRPKNKSGLMKHDTAFFEPNLSFYADMIKTFERGSKSQIKRILAQYELRK